jgi:hypothetical protein
MTDDQIQDEERRVALGSAARDGFVTLWQSPAYEEFRSRHSLGSTVCAVFCALIGEMLGIMWAHYGGAPADAPRARKQLLLDVFRTVRRTAHESLLVQRQPSAPPPDPDPIVHPQPKAIM